MLKILIMPQANAASVTTTPINPSPYLFFLSLLKRYKPVNPRPIDNIANNTDIIKPPIKVKLKFIPHHRCRNIKALTIQDL